VSSICVFDVHGRRPFSYAGMTARDLPVGRRVSLGTGPAAVRRRQVDFKTKAAILAEIDPQILTADGFEEALVGYAAQFNKTVAVYDREQCLKILMSRDGMSEEEAEEFFSFNVEGAFMGERTPAFLTFFDNLETSDGSRGSTDGVDRADIVNPAYPTDRSSSKIKGVGGRQP